jgi:hypothetical protein
MTKFFQFKVYPQTEYNTMCGEIKMSDNNYWIMKWFNPRTVENGITFSENGEIFDLETFELFMNNVRNNVNCTYRRDNESIFIYRNNKFKVNPETCQTGLNFDSRRVHFAVDVSEPEVKNELLSVLQEIYDWAQSLIISNALNQHNL